MSQQPLISTTYDKFCSFGLDSTKAQSLAARCGKILSTRFKGVVKWHQISKTVSILITITKKNKKKKTIAFVSQLLTPDIPFEIHEYLFDRCYENKQEPKYIWYRQDTIRAHSILVLKKNTVCVLSICTPNFVHFFIF